MIPIPKPDNLKLVLIEYLDSSRDPAGFAYLEDQPKPRPERCQSVGWLIHDDKFCKVVMPHMATNEDGVQGCGNMTIPTCAIQRIVELKIQSARRTVRKKGTSL
jgi:hypothetical protein